MLAAGAADGDGEVVAVVADVGRQPFLDEAFDITEHLLHVRRGFEKPDDRAIAPG